MNTQQEEATGPEKQCECCGSYDGDPYAILSNGYCLPCDVDARITSGLLSLPALAEACRA